MLCRAHEKSVAGRAEKLAARWRPGAQRRAVGGLVVVFGVRRSVRKHGRAICAPGNLGGFSRSGTYKTYKTIAEHVALRDTWPSTRHTLTPGS